MKNTVISFVFVLATAFSINVSAQDSPSASQQTIYLREGMNTVVFNQFGTLRFLCRNQEVSNVTLQDETGMQLRSKRAEAPGDSRQFDCKGNTVYFKNEEKGINIYFCHSDITNEGNSSGKAQNRRVEVKLCR